jgi:hypothetical protein
MIQKTVTIKNDLLDAFVQGPLGKQLSGENRLGDFAFEGGLIVHRFFVAAGSRDGSAGGVIDNLAVYVPGTSKNGEPGPFHRAYYSFADSFFTLQPRFLFFVC